MAVSSVNSLKRYVLPRVTFTFNGTYYTVGSFPNALQSRVMGLYISYLGDNTGPVSLALGSGAVYALGINGTKMTNLEATIVYQ